MNREELKRLVCYELDSDFIDIKKVSKIISKFKKDNIKEYTDEYSKIMIATAYACDVTPDIIKSSSRSRDAVIARSFIYVHLRNNGYTYDAIGKLFNKDHTTVLFSIKNFKLLIDVRDPLLINRLNKIKSIIPNYES